MTRAQNPDRNFSADVPAVDCKNLADLLDQSEVLDAFDDAITLRFGQGSAPPLPTPETDVDEMRVPRVPPKKTSSLSSEPSPCPGCNRTMRLVGREPHRDSQRAEVFTFECDCGQIVTATTNQ